MHLQVSVWSTVACIAQAALAADHKQQTALTLTLALIWLGFGASDFLLPPEELRAKPAASTRAPTPASSPVDPPPLFGPETQKTASYS